MYKKGSPYTPQEYKRWKTSFTSQGRGDLWLLRSLLPSLSLSLLSFQKPMSCSRAASASGLVLFFIFYFLFYWWLVPESPIG